MPDWKRMYTSASIMLDKYQNEIVPRLRKVIEDLESSREELRESFVDYVCSGIPNPAPYCENRCPECVDGRGWCKEDPATCRGFNPLRERREGE